MKVKKMSFVLLIVFFITNTVSTVFASNWVSNEFYGTYTKKVHGRDLKVSIEMEREPKIVGKNDYEFNFTAEVSYEGNNIYPDKDNVKKLVQFMTFYVDIDDVEQELYKDKDFKMKKIARISRGGTVATSAVQKENYDTFLRKKQSYSKTVYQEVYKPGSIRGRIIATLKMKNDPTRYRIEARTKSKFWYPWNRDTWERWIINKNEKWRK